MQNYRDIQRNIILQKRNSVNEGLYSDEQDKYFIDRVEEFLREDLVEDAIETVDEYFPQLEANQTASFSNRMHLSL